MLRINNKFFSGYIRESDIEAVWSEKEKAEELAENLGPWRVMIRAAGHEYVYSHCSGEYSAHEAVEEIIASISRAPGMEG